MNNSNNRKRKVVLNFKRKVANYVTANKNIFLNAKVTYIVVCNRVKFSIRESFAFFFLTAFGLTLPGHS